MNSYWNHFKTITKHKIAVFKNCKKAGIIWQGLIHDLSKYSPTEFLESVKYYRGTSSPIDACKKEKGYSEAWLHHKGRNKHHYEYWVDNLDKGMTPIQMPFKYALELVCDYIAAGQVYQGNEFTFAGEYEWWLQRSKNGIAMDIKTQRFVTYMLKQMAKEESDRVLNKYIAKKIWNKC